MLATKQTDKQQGPVSVRLEPDEQVELDRLKERFPLYSRNTMLRAAVRNFIADAKSEALDANLKPLRRSS